MYYINVMVKDGLFSSEKLVEFNNGYSEFVPNVSLIGDKLKVVLLEESKDQALIDFNTVYGLKCLIVAKTELRFDQS